MVSRDLELFGKALEKLAAAFGLDLRLLPVHQFFCVGYRRAVSFADTLMSEADTQDRELASESSYDLLADTCICGTSRTGRDDDTCGAKRFYLLYCHLIVPDNLDVGLVHAEELVEVV